MLNYKRFTFNSHHSVFYCISKYYLYCEAYIRLYGGSRTGYIQRGVTIYDGAYLNKDNRNLCKAADAICVAEYWGENVQNVEVKFQKGDDERHLLFDLYRWQINDNYLSKSY